MTDGHERGEGRGAGRTDEEVRALLEATDLRDQIAEIRDGALRERNRELLAIGLSALALAVIGLAYGTPGFLGAGMILLLSIIPVTRRMALTHRIRRLTRELERVENRRLRAVAERYLEEDAGRGGDPPTLDAAPG